MLNARQGRREWHTRPSSIISSDAPPSLLLLTAAFIPDDSAQQTRQRKHGVKPTPHLFVRPSSTSSFTSAYSHGSSEGSSATATPSSPSVAAAPLSSTTASSRRHRRRVSGTEDDADDDGDNLEGEEGDRVGTDDDDMDDHRSIIDGGDLPKEKQLGPMHYLPLVFVALPLLGGALVGRADSWRDVLVVVLVAWWMWFLIKSTCFMRGYRSERARRVALLAGTRC